MEDELKAFKLLLIRWLRWDADVWSDLEEDEVQLLFDRLVEENTYQEIGEKIGITSIEVWSMFTAILSKLRESHGNVFVRFLFRIEEDIETRNDSKLVAFRFDVYRVWLN